MEDHRYLPLARYPEQLINEVYSDANELLENTDVLEEPSLSAGMQQQIKSLTEAAAHPHRRVPKVYFRENKVFKELLTQGYPMHIRDNPLIGPWGLDDLKAVYGNARIVAIELDKNDKEVKVRKSLSEFLDLFVTEEYYGRARVSRSIGTI